MKICITGDFFLGGDLNDFGQGVISSEAYYNADLRIINIEQAISSNDIVVEKSTLYAAPDILKLIEPLQIDVAALSNNHIHDKGIPGIHETLDHLRRHSVKCFGAGKNLAEAEKPLEIGNGLFVLGYCEHSRPYLSKVQVADTSAPGVNPFSYKKIVSDLSELPDGSKAIVHLHWGREHVALPDRYHIDMARKIINHPKVALLAGMHSHRVQGFVKSGSKKGYLSLGNFLFPNFFIKPRTQITYPDNPETATYKTTKDYHFVGKLTYKVWRLVNRISLMIIYDTETGETEEVPVFQSRNKAQVRELRGLSKKAVLCYVRFLSKLYLLPDLIYNPLQVVHRRVKQTRRYSYVLYFLIRQNGLKWTITKAKQYLKK